jgi:hypothetical protein
LGVIFRDTSRAKDDVSWLSQSILGSSYDKECPLASQTFPSQSSPSRKRTPWLSEGLSQVIRVKTPSELVGVVAFLFRVRSEIEEKPGKLISIVDAKPKLNVTSPITTKGNSLRNPVMPSPISFSSYGFRLT